MIKAYIFVLVVVLANSLIFPTPKSQQLSSQQNLTINSACHIFQTSSSLPHIESQYYLSKILQRINKNQACQRLLTYRQNFHTLLKVISRSDIKAEGYQILISQSGIEISFSDYSGYVYALQSLSQIVKDNKIPYGIVKDEPLLAYRGIMIDSARHYLKVSTIKKLLQSMPLSKLNILHWHIVDDQSFPLKLGSHPELSDYSSFKNNLIYTTDDVKELIKIGDLNAVKIIPEIDTPAHVRSWGLAPQWVNKNITIKCNGGQGYNGQFDLSKPEVFELSKDVIKEVDDLFRESPFIHLGGDQVSSNCWDLRPEIKSFMKLKNIQGYGQLQMYWRFQMKQVLPQSRRVIFWRNNAVNVTIGDNDILHYWGAQKDVANVSAGSNSKIILSPSDILYLNKGQGNLWLNGTQGQYSIWREIYEKFIVFPQGVDRARIYGAQVCLWGEVSNDDTLENNLWMRSTAFAARVWTETVMQTYEIVASMVKIQRALNDKGIDASPFTSEFCEYKPEICWPPKHEQAVEVNADNIVQQA